MSIAFFRPHRGWFLFLAFAVLLLAGSMPLLRYAHHQGHQKLQTLKSERVKAEQELQQMKEDEAAAQSLHREIDIDKAERILAPVDRLQIAAMIENEARHARLEHLTYTLSPEQKINVDAGGDKQELAVATITLAAEASQDLDAYSFINNVGALLPGWARLQQLTVERIGGGDTLLAPKNVRLSATFEWLSNGSLQTVAGTP